MPRENLAGWSSLLWAQIVPRSLQCAVLSQPGSQKLISHSSPETRQRYQNAWWSSPQPPPVTGPGTPNWAITGILSSVLEQLNAHSSLGSGGGLSPGAQELTCRCCSCSFPRSNPESSFLPSRTSQATAVSRSTPEALHTARHGKEGIIQRFSQLLVPCESSQWAHWESEFVVIIIARKYFYFYESVTKPFPGLCSLFCMEKPLFKTRI